MTKSKTSSTAFAVGLIFPFIFFGLNDPDRAKFSVIVILFAVVLIPAATIISAKSDRSPILAAAVMLFGFFIGTCISLICYYPGRSNLLPIAAAIWTILAGIPVVLGSLLGFLIAVARSVKNRH